MTLSELIDRARRGDERAIAQLIEQSLSPPASVKAQWHHHQLQLLLESAQSLDPETILSTLQRGFERLEMLCQITSIRVYSRHPHREFPDWSEEFTLTAPRPAPVPAPEPSSLPVSPSESSSTAPPSPSTPAATPSPPPPETEPYLSDTTLVALAHIAPLFSYLFLFVDILPGWPWGFNGTFLFPWRIVAPLLLLLLKGSEDTFLKRHAQEALNFQISFLLYWIFTLPLMLILVGFLIALPLALIEVICVIIAAVKASDAKLFRYPLTIRFVKE